MHRFKRIPILIAMFSLPAVLPATSVRTPGFTAASMIADMLRETVSEAVALRAAISVSAVPAETMSLTSGPHAPQMQVEEHIESGALMDYFPALRELLASAEMAAMPLGGSSTFASVGRSLRWLELRRDLARAGNWLPMYRDMIEDLEMEERELAAWMMENNSGLDPDMNGCLYTWRSGEIIRLAGLAQKTVLLAAADALRFEEEYFGEYGLGADHGRAVESAMSLAATLADAAEAAAMSPRCVF